MLSRIDNKEDATIVNRYDCSTIYDIVVFDLKNYILCCGSGMVEVRDNQVFHKHFIKQRVNCALSLDEKTHEKLLVGTNLQLVEYNISTQTEGRSFSQGTCFSIKRVNKEVIIVK